MMDRVSLDIFITRWERLAIEFQGRGVAGAYFPGGRTVRHMPDGPDLWEAGLKQDGYQPQVRKSWMELAAWRPAPMARMTVAWPVTMSPPAQTRGFLVLPVHSSVRM